MNGARVWVRRERPTALAWSVALATTMLAVYVLTLSASLPDAAESASAAPRVTREIEFQALEGWCVSLGDWPTAAQARAEAARWAMRGAADCVWPADGRWYALGALYASENEARRRAEQLRAAEGLDAGVLPLSAGRVKLRITAPAAQIDDIEAAAAMLRNQADRLSTDAVGLDRGELTPEAARTLCALSAAEAGELADRLKNLSSGNALCAALTEGLSRLSVHLNEIARSSPMTAPALSGMLRTAGMDAFLRLRDVMTG